MKKFFFTCLIFATFSCSPSLETDLFLDIPASYPTLKKVINDPETYRVQILFSSISRYSDGIPTLESFNFALDDQRYFYPASTVKLPVAILALEWLESQQLNELTKESIMHTDSVRPSQHAAYVDSTAQNLQPSIAHYVKKILLVSDNDAYNRLYELLGQDYINEQLTKKGLKNTVINHRLSLPMSEEENRHFNPVRFFANDGRLILEVPARHTSNLYKNADQPTIGKGYMQGGKLIEEPMDFTFKNKFALSDLHGVVQRIVFPEIFPEDQRFQLSEESRLFVLQHMGMFPRESTYPSYELPDYYDGYSKFFKFGTSKDPIPDHFRILNKTGWAYGHLLDGAYVVDLEKGVEFFVSAVIYVNENEILNDDTYQYESVGLPFFAELGEYLYQHELQKPRVDRSQLNILQELFLVK